MIGGVNFQPGQTGATSQVRPKQGNSVQEAIKILSLRLPKQVGPNALAPAALLNAQGSGGNSRIDSVVNTVMGRMFPTGDAPAAAPMVPSAASPIAADGNTRPAGNTPLSSMMPTNYQPAMGNPTPRIRPVDTPDPNGSFPATPPGPDVPYVGPPQQIDAGAIGRELPAESKTPVTAAPEPSASPEPTQDPWNDLMEYIRRKGETPMGGSERPSL